MRGEKGIDRRCGICTRFDERARHDGDARAFEVGEVMLVGVPAQDVDGIEQARLRRDTLRPVEELRGTFGVVPGRAQYGEVEARPVDRGVVPVDDVGLRPAARSASSRGARSSSSARAAATLTSAMRGALMARLAPRWR
jgi:hypothetical protein